jgi:ABC-type Zn uptake system ZnuABC Zn-binding protein ZnuA
MILSIISGMAAPPIPTHPHSPIRRLVAAAAVAGAAVLGLVACGSGTGDDRGAADGPLVVATTTQLADFARTIGGDAVEVHGLIRPNVDAHDIDPSPADLDALARADVILANGVGLEPWLDDAVEASGAAASVTDTSEGVTLLAFGEDTEEDDHADEAATDEEDHGHEGEANPHIWLDPGNARVIAATVTDAIVAALGDDAGAVAEVEARARAYDDDLVALDAEIEALLADLPDRQLVTDHDAFAYFAARYDLEVVGTIIPSFDSAAEVSAGDLDDLAATIRRTGTRAVFTEQSLPPDAAEALARKVDVRVVAGADGLYGDSLGPASSPGATYLGMMRHNADSISRNLR